MSTAQVLSQPGTSFLKYPELPKELRLMIIEEAVEEAVRAVPQHSVQEEASRAVQGVRKPTPLPPLSGVNCEWNRVIEMRLFNFITISASDLVVFTKYCSKRHGRLNTIRLAISDADIDVDVESEYFVGNAIAQLLNTMQHWDHRGRERQSLIQVEIDVEDVTLASLDFNVCHGFGTLHHAPTVGALYEVPHPEGDPLLHPSSTLALYRVLPNVCHAGLNLRRLDDLHLSMPQGKNDIASLGTIYPSLTRLELLADLYKCITHKIWELWAPGADCLAAFPPSWYNTLVRLDLKQVKMLPAFLAEAGRVAWPSLETLVLLGDVGSHGKDDQQLHAMNKVTCTTLVRGLTTMLPNTPRLKTVLIEMVDFARNWDFRSLRIQMRFGNVAQDVEASFGPSCSFESCSYEFLPTHDTGTAVVSGSKVSGEVATELQRIVRLHQRKDLSVFFHYFNSSTWGRGLCRQWNTKTRRWDVAFEHEADELIYQLGQYFDSTEPPTTTTN